MERGKLSANAPYGAVYGSSVKQKKLNASKNEQWATTLGLGTSLKGANDKNAAALLQTSTIQKHNNSYEDIEDHNRVQSWINNMNDTAVPDVEIRFDIPSPQPNASPDATPCVIIVQDDAIDDKEEFESLQMSNKGRYLGLSKLDRKLSRVDAASIRNLASTSKLPLHNENIMKQRKMSSLNFYGGNDLPQGPPNAMLNSYSAMDKMRNRSRALINVIDTDNKSRVTSMTDTQSAKDTTDVSGSITNAETVEKAITFAANDKDSAPSTSKKQEQATLGLGAIVNLRKWRLKSRDKYGQNSKMGFAVDEEHLKFLRDFSNKVASQIPLPLLIDIYQEVLPILHDTVKAYRELLGDTNRLTLDAEERTEELEREVTAMTRNM